MFNAIGYEVAHVGYSQWNGVAILSRVGIEDVQIGFPGQPTWGETPAEEARALGATCGGVRVWSLYVPNGRTLTDPHYQYKLDWLASLRTTAAGWLADDSDAPVALVGDWNIAPENDDVWDMSVFAHSTHVSPPERAAFRAIVDAGYADVVRPYTPGPGVYTYWDYTQLRFPRREGMRIDFVLGSPALAGRVTGARIDREERKGKGASDHAPVIVDLAD
jgi:exodeoxyribonuclease III